MQRLRRNPLFRALRIDKLITQALEATLRHLIFEQWDQIPVLRMLRITGDEIRERAERIREGLPQLDLIPGESVPGGGAAPGQTLPTWLLAIPGDAAALERALRAGEPPVIARVEDGRLALDLRTVLPEEEQELARTLATLCRRREE